MLHIEKMEWNSITIITINKGKEFEAMFFNREKVFLYRHFLTISESLTFWLMFSIDRWKKYLSIWCKLERRCTKYDKKFI